MNRAPTPTPAQAGICSIKALPLRAGIEEANQ